jgi:hypothetical protein
LWHTFPIDAEIKYLFRNPRMPSPHCSMPQVMSVF